MKTKLSFVLFLSVIVLLAVLLSACGDLGGWLPDPNAPPAVDDGGKENETPEEPVVPEPEKVVVTLKNQTRKHKIGTIELDAGTTLTEENIDYLFEVIDPLGGYRFVEWSDENGVKLDTSLSINESITVYGKRDNLGGVDIDWSISDDFTELTINGTGAMYDFYYNDDAPWARYAKLVTTISIVGEITTVGNMSFYGFDQIGEVILPDSVTRIGNNAFYESSLRDINFPKNLTEIGGNAFYKCDGLTVLNFNRNLKTIGNAAFEECAGIKKVILTDNLSLIDGAAFNRCESIESVYYVGSREQYDTIRTRLNNFWVRELANTYYLSESKPDNRGPYWHYDEEGNIQQWYYTVSYYAKGALVPFAYDYVDPTLGVVEDNIDFMNAIVYNGYRFATWRRNRIDRPLTLGEQLTTDVKLEGQRGNICGDNMTWSRTGGAGTTLKISGSGRMWDFKTLKDSPWYGLNITDIVIEDGVEYIGSFAFCNLTEIKKIDIPTGVTALHKDAFSGCNKLQYIYYIGSADDSESVENLFELNGLIDTVVYTHSESGDTGDGAFWRDVDDSGIIRRTAWEYANGRLVVGGDVNLVNYSNSESTPWHSYSSVATELTVRSGAIRVGAYTFSGFAAATSISIPNTVMKIAGTAFVGSGVYNDPDNWVDGALYISGHLIKVDAASVGEFFTIKEGTVSLADNCFEGCATIKYLVFDKSVKGIYSNVFVSLTGLEEIYYTGTTFESWNALVNDSDNTEAAKNIRDGVVVYCYSKFSPSADGNYWHYAGDAVEKWQTLNESTSEDA